MFKWRCPQCGRIVWNTWKCYYCEYENKQSK